MNCFWTKISLWNELWNNVGLSSHRPAGRLQIIEVKPSKILILASKVLCSEERVCENPIMAFPIKKRINTELFIDSTTAIYIGETLIRVVTNEGDRQH